MKTIKTFRQVKPLDQKVLSTDRVGSENTHQRRGGVLLRVLKEIVLSLASDLWKERKEERKNPSGGDERLVEKRHDIIPV